jgi:phage anti-repressor protein
MSKSLNIVELIETNPITRLSNTYQNKLLNKIKERFTDDEQQIFIASFYCYLNYNSKTNFLINLDDIWKWLHFSTKQKSKELLEKNFIINKDYILLNLQVKQSPHIRGGHNKETFMLNIDTFKKFCLKAGTKKADEIHEYYIRLEETLQEVIQEESNELKLQLEQKEQQLENITQDKEKIREKTLMEQFPNNTQCVYYGIIDNLSDKNEKLIKYGNSNNLKNRVIKHKDTYSNFILINAFKVDNKLQIENALKENKIFTERQRNITLGNKKYIELLNIEGITFTELDKIIKDIITSIEYSPENYIKILEDNKLFKKQLEEQKQINNTSDLILLKSENKKLKTENIKLIKKYNALKKRTQINDSDEELDYDVNIKKNELIQEISQNEIDNYGTVINTISKKNTKNENGTYNIDNKIYEKLFGSREDVWNCKAYKTTGGLLKNDLILNISGKIVSKKKCIQETANNRFEKCGINKKHEKLID